MCYWWRLVSLVIFHNIFKSKANVLSLIQENYIHWKKFNYICRNFFFSVLSVFCLWQSISFSELLDLISIFTCHLNTQLLLVYLVGYFSNLTTAVTKIFCFNIVSSALSSSSTLASLSLYRISISNGRNFVDFIVCVHCAPVCPFTEFDSDSEFIFISW